MAAVCNRRGYFNRAPRRSKLIGLHLKAQKNRFWPYPAVQASIAGCLVENPALAAVVWVNIGLSSAHSPISPTGYTCALQTMK
jgi:hypothetical protein